MRREEKGISSKYIERGPALKDCFRKTGLEITIFNNFISLRFPFSTYYIEREMREKSEPRYISLIDLDARNFAARSVFLFFYLFSYFLRVTNRQKAISPESLKVHILEIKYELQKKKINELP